MKINFIPVNTPLIDGNELKYVSRCLKTGWISSEGAYVKLFEKKICGIVNRKYAVAVSSGTVALDVAITASGLKEEDEIIMPAGTIISCVNQVLKLGAKPIFVDSKLDTLNMDPLKIESLITKKTKAILIVHLYGLPAEVDKIMKIANKYKLIVIEDSAEMLGQYYKKRPCGSFGLISIFSFYANKIVTTGEGGMIVTNSKKIYNKCSELRNLCFKKNKRFIHFNIGWNYRMTNLQAAIGLAQLERLDKIKKIKRNIGIFYNKKFDKIGNFYMPIEKTKYAKNIYWVYTILLKKKYKITAENICKKLIKKGIETRPMFFPLNRQPILKKMGVKKQNCPNAEHLYKYGFYIPSGLGISRKNQLYVSKSLIDVLKE
jgi:perosamine synthetase